MRAFVIYGEKKMTENIATFIFKVCFYLLFFGIISHTYNIDKKSAIIFTGPKESYFGYSVGILKNKEGTVILVGAPKDNTTAHPNISKPGQLYKCHYKSKRCQPVTVNDAGNTEETINYHNKKVTFHNDMKDQWLGMTLDVEPNNHSSVMVCAPRWTDSYLEKKMKGISHMNGICYLLDPDLVNPGKPLPALTNLKRLVNRKSHYVEFSMGAMGFSASYSKENGTLLFGAPGLNDWSGGVVIETVTGEKKIKYFEPPRQEYQNSYSGYAISTGRFISKNTFSIAVGAPRAANIGKVLLYSSKSTIGPLLTVEGTQVGSYFGASLCSLSIDSGLLDGLVIGAPMYSTDGPEEGQVVVFKSHGLVGFEKVTVLSGSRKPYSRFGTAVTNIGDLDKDGYEDIAVGAPFEEEGRGSVYIYNGYKLGLWSRSTQRITAAEIDKGIRTFGISFSRPYDVDQNGYTDIAVGAYQSDHTVVLLSQPLVDMTQTTLDILNLQHINGCISHGHYHDNCTNYNLMKGNLVFCLSYKGQSSGVSNSLVVKYETMFDSSQNVSRLYRYNRKNILSNENTEHGKRKLFINRRAACENTTFFIQYTEETNEDVWIEFEYNIRGRKAMLKQFDGNKIKPEILNRRKAKVDLQPECTDSDICENDIMVHGFLNIPGENSTIYVLGRSQKVLLTVNIQNIKTTRDITIQVHYSKTLSFIKGFRIGNNGRRLPCDVDEFSKTYFSVSCRVRRDSELDNYDNMSAIYEFYIGKDYLDNVQFEIYAYSIQRKSNNITLDLPVVSQANISVIGIAKPNEVIIRDTNRTEKSEQKISFSYIIYNKGPSLLKNSSIFISYPEIPGVLDMNGLNIVSVPKDSSKYFCSLKSKGHITNDLVRTIDQDNHVQLICDGEYSYCTNIVCRLENIAVRSVTTLNINMLVTVQGSKLQQLRRVSLGSMSLFRNTSEVKGWDQIMLFTETSEKTKIIIDIHNVNTRYEVGEMKIWIIVISAAGGIALFLIISLFMFKVGFFRRLANEDLQLLIANKKLQIADAQRYQNGSLSSHRFYHRHNVNNAAFSDEIDDDETNVLIPFSNGSITCSTTDDEIASVSSEESGYLEPIKTRKQRVFLK